VGSSTIWSQTRTYDNVGNVLQLATTVPIVGGGTQTDNQSFCYDALSRLIWAGNSGTPSGGDHCGNAPSGTTLSTYQQSFSYDNLDRLTSGPAGTITYGDPNHVHAATNLSSIPNQYASYDPMGNMVCRNTDTTSGHACGNSPTGALMTYDVEGRLTKWTAPSGTTATDTFLYDGEGNRVLQETSTSSITDTITFDGYTETVITGGTPITTKYYSANGQRVAMRTSSTLSYLLADALGSSTVALDSTGATQAVQLFTPYGSVRYSQGSMPTTYNFTGQRLDSQTGLLYYNFRYYDPFSGQFTRADTQQNNASGMDPYAYVGNNPETKDDPTGHDGWTQAWNVVTSVFNTVNTINKAVTNVQLQILDFVTGASSMVNDVKTIFNGKASLGSKLWAGGDLAFNAGTDVLMFVGIGEEIRGGELLLKGAGEVLRSGDELLRGGEDVLRAGEDVLHSGEDLLHGECGPLSFTPDTAVTTDHGKQAIGTLQVGERVLAYNPRTHKMEQKPILHVWINHDHDLVDLTITTTTKGPDGKVTKTSEVIHTNQKHPFFTLERGFLPVGQIKLGMHILRADGRVGVVTGWKVVPGTKTMYNLEVAQDHTFTVGIGQWVVHNNCGPGDEFTPGGRRLTSHAQDSVPGHGLTPGQVDDAIDNYSYKGQQADDATVFIQKLPGRGRRYNVAIVGDQGVVTAIGNLDPRELNRLASRYGWLGWPWF